MKFNIAYLQEIFLFMSSMHKKILR